MSAHDDYLQGLLALARQGRPDPLRDVIKARLEGRAEPVHGLTSPPLSREEPDANLLLYHAFQSLAAQEDEAAREHLRRVVGEMAVQALTNAWAPGLADALGRLAGFLRVRDCPDLARALRLQLWGLLDARLDAPMERLMTLEGAAQDRARRTLDLWLALTPAHPPDWTEHQRSKVRALFDQGYDVWRVGSDGKGRTAGEARFHLLVLMYRAIMKVDPGYAGCTALEHMVRPVEELNVLGQAYRRLWLGLCWEYRALFREALARMGGLDQDVRAAWEPAPLAPERRPVPTLRAVRGGRS
jgi:hypothetical protein